MTNRDARPVGWFKLSSAYYADAKIVPLGMGAETLFLRILALASGTSSGGLLTMEQILLVSHKIRSVQKAVDELVEADLLAVVHKRGTSAALVELDCPECAALVHHQCSASAGLVQEQCSSCAALVQHQCRASAGLVQGYRITAYRKWNLSSEEPAAQLATRIEDSQSAHARGPARGKTDRKTDRETLRPASPDGRNVSDPTRAAPRSAGGAAQHAPGQWNGAVREPEDFVGPRRVAPAAGGDSLAKSQALAQLAEFARTRGLPFDNMAKSNGKTTAIREALETWEASGGEDE